MALWQYISLVSCREQDRIIGSLWGILGADRKPVVTKMFDNVPGPEDVQIVDGRSYVMNPPMWEERMNSWLQEQEEFAKTFDTLEEYVSNVKSMMAILD